MSGGRNENLARRARLVERAAGERDELAALFGRWQKPLEVVDWGLAFVRSLKRSAGIVAVGFSVAAVALAAIRPRQIIHWFWGGLEAWRLIGMVRRFRAK